MNSIKLFIGILLIVVLAQSCYTQYKIKDGSIRSNSPLKGVIITKVDSIKHYDQWGVPDKFSLVAPGYQLVYSVNEKPAKKVNLFVTSDKYKWLRGGDTLTILPQLLKQPGWYHLSGIRSYGRGFSVIIYNIDPSGKIKQYYRTRF